jgi:hypothetical protein
MTRTHFVTTAVIAGLLAIAAPGRPVGASQGAQTPDQQLAAFKQSLAENSKRLRQYEWIETTIISLKGEEKARKQQRCYYGADGKLQKVAMGEKPEAPASGGGGRGGRVKGRIVENKKDEMQDYMTRAVALVHKYVPPVPADVQRAKDAGRMAVQPPAQGRVSLDFTSYLLSGDKLGVDLDVAASRLLGLRVATYLDKAEDKVTLNVKMGALADGVSFPEEITFDATAKNIRVVIQNSGYRPLTK